MRPSGARRVYRLLLWLAPRRIRSRHADEMEAMFLDALAGARGTAQATAVWVAALLDLPRARLRDTVRRRPSIPGIPAERRTFMIGTDLRYTVRWLGRQKLSTSLVVGMLAVGMAANIVVFSLVNGLFLRPFPFPDPGRLVDVNERAPRWNLEVVGINYPDFHQWRQANHAFESLAIYDASSFNVADDRGTPAGRSPVGKC